MMEASFISGSDVEATRGVRFALRLAFWAFLGTVLLFVAAGKLPPELKNLPTKVLFLILGVVAWRRQENSDSSLHHSARGLLSMPVVATLNIAASQAAALLPVLPLVALGAHVTPPAATTFSLTALLLSLLIDVALTASGEELLYRGGVLPALRPLGDRAALWISATLFAMAHVGFVSSFLWALLLGLVAGIARMRTGSIIPGLVVHAVGNTLGLAMSFSVALNSLAASWLVPGPHLPLVAAGCAVALAVWALAVAGLFRWLGWRWPEPGRAQLSWRALVSVSSGTLVVLYVAINVALTFAMFRSKQSDASPAEPPASQHQ